MLLLFIVIFLVLICYFLFNLYYKKTSYYQISHKPYLQIRTDIGSFGEYYIYKNLRSFEKNGAKFLFNCYLPRENGTTTEIDVLLLHHSGTVSYTHLFGHFTRYISWRRRILGLCLCDAIIAVNRFKKYLAAFR